jgi:ubiquitin C-terminal hydrolase
LAAEQSNLTRRSSSLCVSQCLLFNLKRYEFNLATLTRDKVNDYYAFPDMVDMWPYTEEGLAAGAERSHSHAHAQSSSSQSRDAAQHQQYLYRLRGVVVQSGTEKSGHYYSYIQVRLPAHVCLHTRSTSTRSSSGPSGACRARGCAGSLRSPRSVA